MLTINVLEIPTLEEPPSMSFQPVAIIFFIKYGDFVRTAKGIL